jgi:hypothetical protein
MEFGFILRILGLVATFLAPVAAEWSREFLPGLWPRPRDPDIVTQDKVRKLEEEIEVLKATIEKLKSDKNPARAPVRELEGILKDTDATLGNLQATVVQLRADVMESCPPPAAARRTRRLPISS